MQPTRGCWTVLGVGAVLAGLSVVLESALYLVGAVGLWAWVVADQVRFARTVSTVSRQATVEQSLSSGTVREGQPVMATAILETTEPTRSVTGLDLAPPLAARCVDDDGGQAVEAVAESHRASATYEFEFTGRFEFEAPTVALESARGLFTERARLGPRRTCTVEPNAPTDVVIGEPGNHVGLAVGSHTQRTDTGGITPGETRPYVAGDSRSRIDWKTTARQGEPYVREFEATSSLETLLFVDHRDATSVGVEGRRALDYLRSVGLWVVDNATKLDDPMGLYTVGDDGLTGRTEPSTQTSHYRSVRTALHDLSPTRARSRPQTVTPLNRQVRRTGDDSAFGRILSTYGEHGRGYVETIADEPLFRSVQSTVTRVSGTPWVVLLTTDANPNEVVETVRAVRERTAHVTVFVAPTVLFERGSLGDLDEAYGRYEAFERFRTLLVSSGVDAYEVAPGERLDVLVERTADQREVPG